MGNETVSAEVAEILRGISDVLAGFSHVLGAVLTGSASRGEESYIGAGDKRQLISDIEFCVVVDKRAKQACLADRQAGTEGNITAALKEAIAKHYARHNNPLFHIDFSIYYPAGLRHADRRFFIFETKECGRQFFGETDVLGFFPRVTLANLNRSELQTVIAHRVYSAMKGIWLTDNGLLRRYVIARNILDIPTVILPYEEILLATYQRRLGALKKIAGREQLRRFFDIDGLIGLLDFCWGIKQDPEDAGDRTTPERLLSDFIINIKALAGYVASRTGGRLFEMDKRGITRSIAHMSAKRLFVEISRPRLTAGLYTLIMEQLERYLSGKAMDPDTVNRIRERMLLLFGYC